MSKVNINRSYILRLYGTKGKFESLEWSAYQFNKLSNAFINNLYFNDNVFFSTKNLGLLGNQAQRKATGIVRSKVGAEQKNKSKKTIPVLKLLCCFGNVDSAKNSSFFDYKIKFPVSFASEKARSVYLFSKSIRPLKASLRNGWSLSSQCELFFDSKDNLWYVRVFLSKQVMKSEPKNRFIGIDVGITHSIATSEGYLGVSLSKQVKKVGSICSGQSTKSKKEVDELRLFPISKKIKKTVIKQLLDKEAKQLIARGLVTSSNLVVEDPKILANLRRNSLNGWARCYFANRLHVLGRENGVFVLDVNPAYTSMTCYECGEKDKQNRKSVRFHCSKCGHKDHADINAAKNIARKGQEKLDRSK